MFEKGGWSLAVSIAMNAMLQKILLMQWSIRTIHFHTLLLLNFLLLVEAMTSLSRGRRRMQFHLRLGSYVFDGYHHNIQKYCYCSQVDVLYSLPFLLLQNQ
jgi:hypothetical protein